MGAKIIVEGNLGGKPELRHVDVTVDGVTEKRAVCGLSVFQSHDKLDKQSGEYVDAGGFWCDVDVWGRRAEYLAKLLDKGNPVRVEGDAHIRHWTDNSDKPRQTVKVVANDVTLQLYTVEAITFKERQASAQAEPQTGERA